MDITKIIGMKFKSTALVSTDIHNGGTIFGIIYYQIIEFFQNDIVKISNVIAIDNSSTLNWSERVKNENWAGKYTFASDFKHVKCELKYQKTEIKKVFYANFFSENILVAEIYDNEATTGYSQVYEKIN